MFNAYSKEGSKVKQKKSTEKDDNKKWSPVRFWKFTTADFFYRRDKRVIFWSIFWYRSDENDEYRGVRVFWNLIVKRIERFRMSLWQMEQWDLVGVVMNLKEIGMGLVWKVSESNDWRKSLVRDHVTSSPTSWVSTVI